MKADDTAVSYGGEEFAIIHLRTTLQGAKALLESNRTEFHRTKWQHKSSGKEIGVVTASFDVARLRDQEPIELLIGRADADLYTAKSQGRDCIVGTS